MTLISSLIKESKHTEEHLALARSFFDLKDKFCRTANFAIILDKERCDFIGSSCHFSTQHPNGTPYLVATEIGATRCNVVELPKVTFEELRPMLDWFVNRSPWAPLIVNKDDGIEEIYHTGVIFHTNVPLQFLQAGLITTRMFYEQHLSMFQYFNKLVESGANEAVAFGIVCSNIYVGNKEDEDVTYAIPYTGHRPLNPLTPAGLANLANGVMGKACPWDSSTLTYFEGGRLYRGGVKTFHDVEWVQSSSPAGLPCIYFPFEDAEVRVALKAARGDTEPEVYTPPNPFKRLPVDSKTLKKTRATLREFWDIIVPIVINRTDALLTASAENKEEA